MAETNSKEVWTPKLLYEGESPADLETYAGMRSEINLLFFKPLNFDSLLFSFNTAILANSGWESESDPRNKTILIT